MSQGKCSLLYPRWKSFLSHEFLFSISLLQCALPLVLFQMVIWQVFFLLQPKLESPWVSLITGHWRRGHFFRDLAVSIQGFTQAKQKLYLPPKTLYDSGFWSSSQKLIPAPGFFLEPQVCWLNLPILFLCPAPLIVSLFLLLFLFAPSHY